MNILICVKQVNGELNPFDASALECALQISGASVTLLSMGREEVAEMLRSLTRLGAAHAVLLTDAAFAGADTLATAYALSLAAKRLNPDLIICGRQSVDGDTAQTGPCLAALLGLPVLTHVLELQGASETGVRCRTRFGEESAALPALLTVERGYTLRFPRLRSQPAEVERWNAANLGADLTRCGLRGSPTRVLRTYENTVGRRKCRFVTPAELPGILKQALRTPRCILPSAGSAQKLPEVWAIGEEPVSMARTIAKRVRVIERQPPDKIAALARAEQPTAIFWDTGLWGRRAAPQAAALLQTGLCADCTALETDGERLFMIRPALGGNVTARIECRTAPVMATVRGAAEANAADVIVAAGGGAAAALPLLRTWTERHGYALAASRIAVDQGMLPYECQVGLTGRAVNPVVYLAVGVSGAVQHTCGFEQAGTVIAVNTDKSARIFDYADYGIVGDCAEVFAAEH